MDNDPLIYRISTAMSKLGVSRATIYRLVGRGELTIVRFGKKASGITAESIHAFIQRGGVS
jgi:excisionase family DNA binding protein